MPLTSEMPVYNVPPLSSFGIATRKTLAAGVGIGSDEAILKPDTNQAIEAEFQKVSALKSTDAGTVGLDRSSPSARAISYFRQALRGMVTGHLDTMKSLSLNPDAKKMAIQYAELGEYATSKISQNLDSAEGRHITEKDFSIALAMLKVFNQVTSKIEKETASGTLTMQDVKRDWDQWGEAAKNLAEALNSSMDKQPILMAAKGARTKRSKGSSSSEYANLPQTKEPGEYQNVARATAKLPKVRIRPESDLLPDYENLSAVKVKKRDQPVYASASDVLPGYDEMHPSASAPNPDEPAYTPMHDADSSTPTPPARGASRKPRGKQAIGKGWKDPKDALPPPKTKAPPLPPTRTTPVKGEYAPIGDVSHLPEGKKKPPIYTGVGRQYMAANATLAEPKADGLVDEAKFPATESKQEPKAAKKKSKAHKKPEISTPLGRDPTFKVVRTTADISNLPKSEPAADKKDIKPPILEDPPPKKP